MYPSHYFGGTDSNRDAPDEINIVDASVVKIIGIDQPAPMRPSGVGKRLAPIDRLS